MQNPTFDQLAALECRDYLLWLQEQELKAQKLALPLSRWYGGPLLDAYTRVTRYLPVCRGAFAISFANIEVAAEHQGQGLLTSVLKALAVPGRELQAEFLYFENGLNPRLQAWLLTVGFEPCPFSGELAPSYFRRRVRQ